MNLGSRFDRFAIVVSLAAMAVSQPLLGLFGDNAEFFLARRSPRIDIVVVGLVLGLAVPLLLGLMALMGGRLGDAIFLVLAVVLTVTLTRLVFGLLPVPDWLASLGGIVGGVYATWLIGRFPAAKQMSRYLVAAPIVFTGLFFFGSPTGALLAGEGDLAAPASADRPAPLIWILLDELPAASLMDGQGLIYRERYPNFARLADAGAWFPNTVTVQQQTEHSVPAMLTGIRPDQDLAPYAAEYPDNIFTALADSHDLAVFETVTHLCPAEYCTATASAIPASDRARLLVTDIAIVAGHALMPDFWSAELPPINQGWGYFGEEVGEYDVISEFQESFDLDPRRPLVAAAARVEEGFDGRPPFLFVHALVPHHPWQLLPTGQSYPSTLSRPPGATKTGWGADSWLVNQGMQRHLINVTYADYALGQILAALDGADLFDEAMIIVVADHGIAVSENVEHQRKLNDGNIGEIAAVPLLVKAPGIEPGTVDWRRATTLDIVPTVVDAMSIDLSWEPEGVSLLGPDPQRTSSTTDTPDGPVTYGVDGAEVLAVAQRLAANFPDPDPFVAYPPGSPNLIGEKVDLASLSPSSLKLVLVHADRYEDVNTEADSIPIWVAARMVGEADADDVFAVIVNGEVAAMTRAFEDADLVQMQAFIPPETLRDGQNDIGFALVVEGELQSVERIS